MMTTCWQVPSWPTDPNLSAMSLSPSELFILFLAALIFFFFFPFMFTCTSLMALHKEGTY